MAIKGDGSSLTIALRGSYAQAAWANRSADERLHVFLNLENKKLAVRIVVAFDLCSTFRTKVHKNSYRELGSAEITKGLVVFPFGQLRDGFTLDDDVANR